MHAIIIKSAFVNYFESNLVSFNTAHPAYVKVMGDVSRKKMYLAALVGKELLGKVYHNPTELADRVIAFQQSYLEYLMVDKNVRK